MASRHLAFSFKKSLNYASLRRNVCLMTAIHSRSAVAGLSDSWMRTGQQTGSILYEQQQQQQRRYNTQSNNNQNVPYKIIDYQDIQKWIRRKADSKNARHLIDVREENEVKEGYIPTAVNVPLSQFLTAWTLPSEEFKEKFGFDKPEKKHTLALYCLAGVRSTKAAEYLAGLGYEDLENYVGSWADFIENEEKEEAKRKANK
ncbi:Rhodanese-like domain-containing protein [Mycotypha africana]|uniref:Rhodanese-like domain-containing protein n=1 Tax=Mycotypha africana TaxID=64632 RepID=UPI0022FFFAD0|nr:Rhodanese-like domain-containing protein [Mycotypha africana]KAI8966920.1 Rhodanese-like domain-containing protein [Mycotypha africana]